MITSGWEGNKIFALASGEKLYASKLKQTLITSVLG
jgi:hypothetical protein